MDLKYLESITNRIKCDMGAIKEEDRNTKEVLERLEILMYNIKNSHNTENKMYIDYDLSYKDIKKSFKEYQEMIEDKL